MKGIEDLNPVHKWHLLQLNGEHVYLVPLFKYALDIEAKTMLELGVENGKSTRALLMACTLIEGAHLWSVDLGGCPEAKEVVAELGLTEYWTFTQMDDIEYAKGWGKPVDLIFIDTDHTLELTRKEIACYSTFIRKGGLMIFHDTNTRDVKQAINEFLSVRGENWEYWELGIQHGLGVMKRV